MGDYGHYYDIEPEIDIKHFAELLLVTLGFINSIGIKKEGKIISEFPSDYFDCIEKVMSSNGIIDDKNIVISRFSKLVDIREYNNDRINWQFNLADSLSELLNNYTANDEIDFSFNLRNSCFYFEYPEKKALEILSKYDNETKENMWLFTWMAFNGTDYNSLLDGSLNDYMQSDLAKMYFIK